MIEAIVGGGSGGVPFGLFSMASWEYWRKNSRGIGIVGSAADVFEAPVEGLDAAVVVGGPAAVLVTADFAFKPVHRGSCKLLVYSC